jgi:hypothetical protein
MRPVDAREFGIAFDQLKAVFAHGDDRAGKREGFKKRTAKLLRLVRKNDGIGRGGIPPRADLFVCCRPTHRLQP